MSTASPADGRPWRGWLVAGGILLLVLIVNQSAVHWRSNRADSDIAAWHGWCVTQGARPYLDIWNNKPPGTVWANAAAQQITGPGIASELLLGTVAVTISLLAFIGITRIAYHDSLLIPAAIVGGIILTNLHNECGANRHETFVIVCETVTLLGYLRWLHTGRWRWLVLAGLVAGAAPLFKQAGLAVVAACAGHLLWLQMRGAATIANPPLCDGERPKGGAWWTPWAVGAASIGVVPMMAIAALAAQGALAEARFAIGEFNQAYFAIDDASWTRIDRAIGIYRPVLDELAGLFVIAGLGLIIGVVGWWRGWTRDIGGRIPGFVGLVTLWFLLAFYLACVSPGRRGHHLMPTLPALGLLVLYPLHLLASGRGLYAALAARPSAAVALVIWLLPLGQLAAGSLVESRRCWDVKPHWYALRRTTPTGSQQQARCIRRLTAPTDRIYVSGWAPGVYRYACRLPASRFSTLEKVGQVGEHAQFILEGAIADILRNPPRVFVISCNDYAHMMKRPSRPLPILLQTEYRLVDTISGMHILQRMATR